MSTTLDAALGYLAAIYQDRRVRPVDKWNLHVSVYWQLDLAAIPWEVWNHCKSAANIGTVSDSIPEYGRGMVFDSLADAENWLSSLCVAYGRHVAGLRT